MIDRTFNFEKFFTLLAQIEACLNSRPLTSESSNPNDLNAITPGHFLIGGPLTSLPQEIIADITENRVKKWQRAQGANQMTRIFVNITRA